MIAWTMLPAILWISVVVAVVGLDIYGVCSYSLLCPVAELQCAVPEALLFYCRYVFFAGLSTLFFVELHVCTPGSIFMLGIIYRTTVELLID